MPSLTCQKKILDLVRKEGSLSEDALVNLLDVSPATVRRSDADALALGCATAGYFVRHARSASQRELVAFLQAWSAGDID